MPQQPTDWNDLGLSMESDEAKEIFGASPRWIVRWGNLLVLGTILLLLSLSIFIPFPEVIHGKASIFPVKKTADIYIPRGAVAGRVLVSDRDTVKKGQALLYLSGAGPDSFATAVDGPVITAPADGMVIFQRDIRAIADTAQKTWLMTINPSGQQYNAAVTVGNTGSGKIQIGQKVIIQLDSYPGREFGNITGTVISKPQDTGEHSSILYVALDRNVTTTYNKKLEIYTPVAGTADIITSDKRLIWQIFSFL